MTNMETMKPEKVISITLNITEFGDSDILSFRGKKMDLDE